MGSARFIAAIRQRPLSSLCTPRDDLASALFYFIILSEVLFLLLSKYIRFLVKVIFVVWSLMVLTCGLIKSEGEQRLLVARAQIPRGRENDGAGGRAKSQGSGPHPQGHAGRAGICVFWKRLAARSLERTLSRAQLGPEAELTLPRWECGRAGRGR